MTIKKMTIEQAKKKYPPPHNKQESKFFAKEYLKDLNEGEALIFDPCPGPHIESTLYGGGNWSCGFQARLHGATKHGELKERCIRLVTRHTAPIKDGPCALVVTRIESPKTKTVNQQADEQDEARSAT